MPYPQAHPAGFIIKTKLQGLLDMQRESSVSVRVFYPRFDTQWVMDTLKQKVKELKDLLPISEVVLFGSYARGNYTVRSDVDLLVLYKGKSRKDAYSIVWKVLDIPRLEPHIYTEDEARKMEKLIHRMKQEGKVVYKETCPF